MDDEDRIRQKAHELWEHEGRPDGRAERHWTEAREIVALQDSLDTTLTPVDETLEEPAEPELAVLNQADMPGLTDLGEDPEGPSLERARDLADQKPLSVDRDDAKKPKRRAKA